MFWGHEEIKSVGKSVSMLVEGFVGFDVVSFLEFLGCLG